jgi:phenylacetate-CoA ligase
MPFIRYEIGDVGVKSDEKCPCGRGLPLMKIIEGRVVDFITLPDGNMASPYLLTCAIEKTPGIAKYQIVQKEKDSIIVLIIQSQEFTQHTIISIRRSLEKVLGKDIQIEVNIVDCLPPDKSGKFRPVLSKVDR